MTKCNIRRGKLAWAALAALVTVIAFYAASNSMVPISKENSYLKKLGVVQRFFYKTSIPDDMLFVNISYDRDLVEVTDEFGFPKGNIDITDRQHLTELLETAKRENTHKYIFLDISFDSELKSPYDSTLYELISTTPRLVVPIHADIVLPDERMREKGGWADYRSTVSEGDFVKYVVGDQQKPSLVLKAYEELTGNDVKSWWRFAWSDGHLMRTSMLPVFHFNITGPFDAEGNRQYYNLGSDLLSYSGTLENLINDKYVFVGDFEDVDIHQTYLGYMPGSAIHANMLLNLLGGKHLVGYWALFILWAVFFALYAVIFISKPTSKDDEQANKIKEPKWLKDRAEKSKFFRTMLVWWGWIYSFLGYGSIFAILVVAMLLVFAQIYEALVLSVVFLAISRIANYIKKNYKKK